MSETPQTTPKGPRRSARRPKLLSASEEQPKSILSDIDILAAPSAAESTQKGTSPAVSEKRQKKKKPQSARSAITESGTDEAARQEHNRNTHNNVSNKAKATPTKAQQAYAGPTFHHSPAPSALPIPSFYSKSVPNVSLSGAPEAASDSSRVSRDETSQAGEHLSSQEAQNGVQREPESTPLDFLFEAAKKAKGTPKVDSPDARSVSLSGYESPYNRSPAPREGEQFFPFELESGRSTPAGVAPSFATPYKDRMDALRSTTSSASAASDLSEAEAKAKSDALKRFMNLTPRATSVSSDVPDPNNPFNARAPQTRKLQPPLPQQRHRSGPSTPVSGPANGQASTQYFPNMQPAAYNSQSHTSPMHRPASSHLRHMYHPDVGSSPTEHGYDGKNDSPLISTARKPSIQHTTPRHPRDQFETRQDSFEHMPQHKSKPSAQELEDQLRSILKLDGIASKG